MAKSKEFIFLFACLWSVAQSQNTPAERAQALVDQMTLQEKINMVHGVPGLYIGNILGNDRLSIPALKLNDGPQGFRDSERPGTSTCFPSGMTVGATWDVSLAEAWGVAMGEEFRNKGANVQLGPGMNVARVPTNGRNFEYISGEDPYLGSIMVPATINGIQSQGVIANAKHFVNNNQETNRYGVNAVVDERTMMEIYMPPFEAAVVDGAVGSIMCSYNRITASTYEDPSNSSWACENADTLKTILKERFGFQGWVMSDWFATHSTEKAALNGLDQEMPEMGYFGPLLEAAVTNGTIPESVIDDKVLRILTPMIALGVYDVVLPYGERSNNVSSPEHLDLARNLSAAATVMVKNDDQLLPLSPSAALNIVVVGPAGSLSPIVAGTGSGAVSPAGPVITALQGIQEVTGAVGGVVSYVNGSNFKGNTGASFSDEDAALIGQADVVVVVVGTTSGEGRDRSNLNLGSNQDEMILAAAGLNENTMVVLTTPGAILMSAWIDQVKSALVMFMPGQEMGHAMADVMYGTVNPSARLSMSMPNIDNEVNFTQAEYPGIPDPYPHPVECTVIDGPCLEATYSEGLLVGYRWYHANNVSPLFSFGHGLSYTSFQYDNLNIDPSSNTVSFQLTNTGLVAGSEVAQLYLTYPTSDEPPLQLKGFKKVELKPSEVVEVQLQLTERSLSVWDLEAHDWSELTGAFAISVGASSSDIRLTGTLQK